LKVGSQVQRKAPNKKYFSLCCPSLHFVGPTNKLVVLVRAFLVVSTVRSVSCLLFFYSRCPSCPAISKSVPRAIWSRRHCDLVSVFTNSTGAYFFRGHPLRDGHGVCVVYVTPLSCHLAGHKSASIAVHATAIKPGTIASVVAICARVELAFMQRHGTPFLSLPPSPLTR